MKARQLIRARLARLREWFEKRKRLLFAGPAEIALIRAMGGRVLVLGFWRQLQTDQPAVIVLSMGRIFKSEMMDRRVQVGSRRLAFGNDIRRGIELDGHKYYHDILLQQEADSYFRERDWQVLHVSPAAIKNNPRRVRRAVLTFLVR